MLAGLAASRDRSAPAPANRLNFASGYPAQGHHAVCEPLAPQLRALRPCSASFSSSASTRRKLPAVELEKMVEQTDQRVVSLQQNEGGRLRQLTEQARRLTEGLQAMRAAREIHDERRLKELRMMESSLVLDIGKASHERREAEARTEELGDASLVEHREELRQNHRKREAAHEGQAREFSEEVKRIAAMLDEQRALRVQHGDSVREALEKEFNLLQDAITTEQRLRFETEGTMLRMVEEVCGKMHDEIRQERSQREAVQGKLLGLLEETCSRIEATFPQSQEQPYTD